MKILYRYISLRLAFGWLLVFLILSALFSFLELVGQLDDIGQGSYQLRDAFMYVAYTLPGRVLNIAAVSSLLGAIVALGTLADIVPLADENRKRPERTAVVDHNARAGI